jgi:hypothetical protein
MFVQDTYDAYIEKIENSTNIDKDVQKPDVVAVLNCGFIFYDSWNKTIPYLLRHPNVPLIFTEYQKQDSENNLKKIRSLGKSWMMIIFTQKYFILNIYA